jgi:TetR/AcrR family transcriptional repressor of nem operon
MRSFPTLANSALFSSASRAKAANWPPKALWIAPRQHARGCLLLSANLERETGDAVIAQFLRENQSAVEQIFAQAIAEGQTSGELSKALNPEALARFFAVTIQGMRAMARLKSDRRALRQVAKLALAALDAK